MPALPHCRRRTLRRLRLQTFFDNVSGQQKADEQDSGMPETDATVISDFNRIGIPEVHLRKVRPEHLPGIYGDFREVVENRLAQIRSNDPQSQELRRFFKYLLDEVDADEYRRVQLRYLDP